MASQAQKPPLDNRFSMGTFLMDEETEGGLPTEEELRKRDDSTTGRDRPVSEVSSVVSHKRKKKSDKADKGDKDLDTTLQRERKKKEPKESGKDGGGGGGSSSSQHRRDESKSSEKPPISVSPPQPMPRKKPASEQPSMADTAANRISKFFQKRPSVDANTARERKDSANLAASAAAAAKEREQQQQQQQQQQQPKDAALPDTPHGQAQDNDVLMVAPSFDQEDNDVPESPAPMPHRRRPSIAATCVDLEDFGRVLRRGRRQLREYPLLSVMAGLALILAIVALILGSLGLQEAQRPVSTANIEPGAITSPLIEEKAIQEEHLASDLTIRTSGAIHASSVTTSALHLDSNLSLESAEVNTLSATTIESDGMTTSNIVLNGLLSGSGPIDLTGNITCGGLTVMGSIEIDLAANVEIFHKSAGSDLTISSQGAVRVESVAFDGSEVSGVSNLAVSSNIDLSGSLSFEGPTPGEISLQGDTLEISTTGGKVDIEGVIFDDGVVSGVASLEAGELVASSLVFSANETQSALYQTETGDLVISSDDGDVVVHGVHFSDGDLFSASVTTGKLVVEEGPIELISNSASQAISHTGTELLITSTGPISVQSVQIATDGDITTPGNLGLGGSVSFSGTGSRQISHSSSNPGDNLIIESTGEVEVGGVTMKDGVATADAVVLQYPPAATPISGSSLSMSKASLLRLDGASTPVSITSVTGCLAGQLVVVFNVGNANIEFSGAALDAFCSPSACPAIAPLTMKQIVCTSASTVCCL